MPLPPKPKPLRRAFWREPLVLRSLIGLLLLVMLAEIVVIARHNFTPAKQGERTAAKAERRLGAGPLDPKRGRIDFDRVNARAEALMHRRDMIGMGIAVIEDGQLAFVKGYGETKADSGDKVLPTTLFRWASVSKGVAATMAALLDQRHRLSLNDPVAKWAPSMRLPKGNEQVATLADAISHRLGIVKNAYDDRLEDNVDPREIRGSFGTLFPMCPPGTCFAYQNVGYDVIHEAIEKATGRSYDQAAHELIFGPLGMTSANTTREGLVTAKSWAQPHNGRRTLPVEEAYYRVPAAGGMNSSIIDLGIWMRAQMGGAPNVLNQQLLFTLHVPRVLTPHGSAPYDRAQSLNSYGLGFRQTDYDGHQLVGHRGAVSGYRSMILFDPAEKVGVAILWNSQSVKPTGMALEILDQYYRRPPHDWMEIERP
ncbi:serine hydrolase domain-containing protein [Sphingomonas sp. BIUV-7]|uniref:Serine hydrolase domain-containing protein n=1 Tax=Sphingomonas natans TaxID=3063330 RepID=A0ABT8Y5Z2_9SPHN|nr:serine hydrolase domain-containing protein [Sphingomonas sp. BIUV-7]MDO6413144.1 serine hydrolase domain-containing protein [Sphingomonas sp. BIUV-7]